MEDTLKTKVPNGACSADENSFLSSYTRYPLLVANSTLNFVTPPSRLETHSCAGYGTKVNLGDKEFGRYPENLLNSRVRYSRAFKVRLFCSMPA